MNKIIATVITMLMCLTCFAASAQEANHGALATAPGSLKGLSRGVYADATTGQIHVQMVTPDNDTGKTPFVIFHPNPYSGLYFSYLLEEMGRARVAIAPDAPGYGNSTKPSAPPSMQEIAAAMAAALESLGYGENGKGKVDVSGYHTGTYIASELAAARPDLIRRVVLTGVPFWQGEQLEKQQKELLKPKPIDEDGDILAEK